MRNLSVEQQVRLSAASALVALALMVTALLWPNPYILVLAMSLGQVIGTLGLALFLYAIATDLRGDRAPRGDS